jgi:hypothetical protein
MKKSVKVNYNIEIDKKNDKKCSKECEFFSKNCFSKIDNIFCNLFKVSLYYDKETKKYNRLSECVKNTINE